MNPTTASGGRLYIQHRRVQGVTSAFPWRLVKFCTRRFRGNVTDVAAWARAIRVGALLAAERVASAAVRIRSAGRERAPVMECLPVSVRRAAPQRGAVGPPALVLGGVLEHYKPIVQQSSPHLPSFDRLVIGVRRCGYLRSGSLVADFASGAARIRRSGGKSESVGLLSEPHSNGICVASGAPARPPQRPLGEAAELFLPKAPENTGDVGPQVVRYSERPGLWDALTGLSDEVWPEYNQHGATLNHYWDQLYEIFPDWQFVLYDPGDETVLAEGLTSPWRGTAPTPGWGRALMRPLPSPSNCRQRAGGRRRSARWPPRSRLVTSACSVELTKTRNRWSGVRITSVSAITPQPS